MPSDAQVPGVVSALRQLASAFALPHDVIEKTLLRCLIRKRVLDYLAEMGETSTAKVSAAVAKVGFPETTVEVFSAGVQAELEIVTAAEVERALPSMLDPALFVRSLSEKAGKGEEEILAAMETKVSLRPPAIRYRISQCPEGQTVPFSNVPAMAFAPGSEGLEFSRGKIHFIGLKSPERHVSAERLRLLDEYCDSVLALLRSEPLPVFKGRIMEAHERFFKGEMPDASRILPEVRQKYGTNEAEIIDGFLLDKLGTDVQKSTCGAKRRRAIAAIKKRLKYVITFGIGGNEMRWHALANLHNSEPSSRKKWIPLHSADEIDKIPDDAHAQNTVILSFSRGGGTEETKAAEEVLHGRFPVSIIYANAGELKALGEDHGSLVLPFPRRIAGRYCGLKTSLNLAAMYLLEMDTRAYWEASDRADKALNISSQENLAWQLARFIFLEKELTGVKMMYLGHNSERIGHSLNELAQFVMEGLAKEGNELFAMVGMPYPRNTHYEIEGPLGNPRFFLYWNFLLCQVRAEERFRYAYARDANKQKLYADQVNAALMAAALAVYAKHSPSIVFLLSDQSLETLAYLSKIYEDTIYLLCRLTNVDPFGNPCVKEMRDESSKNVQRLFALGDGPLRSPSVLFQLLRDAY
jgi:glucose-6-phosphate isomerase